MRRWLVLPTAALMLGIAAQGWAEEVPVLSNPSFENGLEGWSLWPADSGSIMNLDTQVRKALRPRVPLRRPGPARAVARGR